jgi:catechol 2,3-dioxygenase-like lactoylglutathione lyase family enzyme
MIFERYSFVRIATLDLDQARAFWVDALGFPVTEEMAGHFFILDAGGLRLCVDRADRDIPRTSSDTAIGLKVRSISDAIRSLASKGLIRADVQPERGERGNYVTLRDPDGRAVIITEVD